MTDLQLAAPVAPGERRLRPAVAQALRLAPVPLAMPGAARPAEPRALVEPPVLVAAPVPVEREPEPGPAPVHCRAALHYLD